MIETDDTTHFLRTAIRTGLRLQRRAGNAAAEPQSDHVAVMQRIRRSLHKRQSKRTKP